jgi:hypothetical protein
VVVLWTYGRIEIQFQSLKTRKPFDAESKRHELLSRLNEILGINFSDDVLTRRPSIPIAKLSDDAVLKQLISIFDWVLAEIKSANQ